MKSGEKQKSKQHWAMCLNGLNRTIFGDQVEMMTVVIKSRLLGAERSVPMISTISTYL